ncbi:UPF0758 protein [Paenibacillus chitinolyticus]|uniref:JAB domain-containing protein n=1 Tax=Paenibacillus chitinolyticus TaxID=79263 RepID=UPI0026E4CA03|nr:DNA repair protein RadC [Paenibacillus chitinolyticus]GKS12803.1 UPF0758 protein [Paenibacillus chitinolyticus]
MNVTKLNHIAVKEVKNTYNSTSDTNRLSNRDLLVMILEPYVKRECLSLVADTLLEKGLKHLIDLSESELSQLLGLDREHCLSVLAILELSRRINSGEWEKLQFVSNSDDVARFCSDMQYLDKEHFVSLYLSRANQVIGRETIAIGSLDFGIVHPREVFRSAISRGAYSVVFVHNHPSGDPRPSIDDRKLTDRLMEVGNIVGIEVVDHVVIGKSKHVSILGSLSGFL